MRKILYRISDRNGFTLIEIIIVIVVLGILSIVAVGKYQDFGLRAKSSACRNALMSMREAISIWRANNIVINNSTSWPPRDTLATVDAVLSHQIPPNPFQSKNNAPDSIVTGITKGVVVGTRGGWAYKQATGEIWANTGTTVSTPGCGGSVAVGENSW